MKRTELERFAAVAPELAEFVARGATSIRARAHAAGLSSDRRRRTSRSASRRRAPISDSRRARAARGARLPGTRGAIAAPRTAQVELLAERAQSNDRARHATAEARARRRRVRVARTSRARALARRAPPCRSARGRGTATVRLRSRRSRRDGRRCLAMLRELIERAAQLDVPGHLPAERSRSGAARRACAPRSRASVAAARRRWSTAIGWASAQLDPRVHEALASAAEKQSQRARRPAPCCERLKRHCRCRARRRLTRGPPSPPSGRPSPPRAPDRTARVPCGRCRR